MKHLHFYDATTGIFTGQSFSISGGDRAKMQLTNTPEGCGAYEGAVDYLSQRVDTDTGQLVDYVPPQPDANHEWNALTKRWLKRADVVERETRRASVLHEISQLESKQDRVIREDRLRPNERDLGDGKTPRERLQAIDDAIAALRVQLSDGKDTSEP